MYQASRSSVSTFLDCLCAVVPEGFVLAVLAVSKGFSPVSMSE